MSEDPRRVGSFQRGKDGRWHEYHGVGQVRPDGSCEFDDDTDIGRHSHAIHSVPDDNGTSHITRHRHLGARYPSDFCEDEDCPDGRGAYGRHGHSWRGTYGY